MYPSITITKGTELETQEWKFTMFDFRLVLDTYYFRTRESKRHKFQTEKSYDRVGGRQRGSLTSNEVPVTEELKAEAKQLFFDKVKVCTWEEK